MIPSSAILTQFTTLLAADTTTLAAVVPPEVALIKSAFVPAPDLDISTLTEADFDGYASITATAGTQLAVIDPATGDNMTQIKEPAGGWHWVTTGLTNLPQTIYGFVLVATAPPLATLYGAQLLATPIVLTGVGQVVDLPPVRFRLLTSGVV